MNRYRTRQRANARRSAAIRSRVTWRSTAITARLVQQRWLLAANKRPLTAIYVAIRLPITLEKPMKNRAFWFRR